MSHYLITIVFLPKPFSAETLALGPHPPLLAEFMTDLSQSHYEALKLLSSHNSLLRMKRFNRRHYSLAEVS